MNKTNEQSIIQFERFHKKWRGKSLFHGFDWNISPGESIGILRKNCLESQVLLYAIRGWISPDEGRVTIWGQDATQLDEEKQQIIGYAGKNSNLPNSKTAEELIELCAPLYSNWNEFLAQDLLNAFNVRSGERIKFLSLAQKKNTLLMLTLCQSPKILLLNNVFENHTQAEFHHAVHILQQVIKNTETTLIMSSSMEQHLLPCTNTQYHISNGKLEKIDPAQLMETTGTNGT